MCLHQELTHRYRPLDQALPAPARASLGNGLTTILKTIWRALFGSASYSRSAIFSFEPDCFSFLAQRQERHPRRHAARCWASDFGLIGDFWLALSLPEDTAGDAHQRRSWRDVVKYNSIWADRCIIANFYVAKYPRP